MGPRGVQWTGVLVCVAVLAAAASVVPSVNRGREALTSYASQDVLRNAPPEYAFAIQAFGAFRGLITNIAFIRAENYKQQGRFYDAMQLANWICKLQPRFPSVWEFHSWNMAWNISVTTYTPQERWNWVYNGVKLLRDEGIRWNPRAINLYKQLAWIFVNKMSESVDDFHMAYKREWAWRMHLLLGSPPDPLGDYRPDRPFETVDDSAGKDPLLEAAKYARKQRLEKKRAELNALLAAQGLEPLDPNDPLPEEIDPKFAESTGGTVRQLASDIVRAAAAARMKEIADAPDTLESLYAAQPEARAMVEALRPLGVKIGDDPLTEEDYWREEGLAFRLFYRYRLLTDPPSMLSRVLSEQRDDPLAENLDAFDAAIGARAGKPAGLAVVRFCQKKVLREVYKMDSQRMFELMARFGPIDWRGVDAHSLYWVNEGLIAGNETITSFSNDKVNTARLIFFSLRNLFYRNRLIFEPHTRDITQAYFSYNPDINFIEPMHQAYLAYGREYDPRPTETGAGETFRAGHINFLSEAIRLLWFAGREKEAQHYYEYLATNYDRNSDGSPNLSFRKPLRDYVIDGLRETLGGWKDVRAAIYGSLMAAFTHLASGNLSLYGEMNSFALDQHAQFNAGKINERIERLQLPPFREMKADVLRDWLAQPAPAQFITAQKARLWTMLPVYLRQAVYDDLFPIFEKECELARFNLDAAFPEPPGMTEIRAAAGRQAPQRKSAEGTRETETLIQSRDQ